MLSEAEYWRLIPRALWSLSTRRKNNPGELLDTALARTPSGQFSDQFPRDRRLRGPRCRARSGRHRHRPRVEATGPVNPRGRVVTPAPGC